ncbi:MAG TPA: hypothetical protein VEL28_18165 [Candidatus Binatia bacterium]|nr:hypothetical protein [Candidatus Binatia bacterium]
MRLDKTSACLLAILVSAFGGCGPSGGGEDLGTADFFLSGVGNRDLREITFTVNPPDGVEFQRPHGRCEGPAGVAASFEFPPADSIPFKGTPTVALADGADASTTTTMPGTGAGGACDLNGVREGTEECDDGNDTDDDDVCHECIVQCQGGAPDTHVDPGEECDDGNQVDGDTCSNECQKRSLVAASISGSGILTVTVIDRSGIDLEDDEPLARCSYEGEGADMLIDVESCVLGGTGVCNANVVNSLRITIDTTTSTTVEPECGNGDVEEGEECDTGDDVDDNSPCTEDCNDAICGDGLECNETGCTTGPGGGIEECDDGNEVNTDTCSNACEDL